MRRTSWRETRSSPRRRPTRAPAQPLTVGVAADDPVQYHQVVRPQLELGTVALQQLAALSDTGLLGALSCLRERIGIKLHACRVGASAKQRTDQQAPVATADLQH